MSTARTSREAWKLACLGEAIRQLREQRGLSVSELDGAGLLQRRISRLKAGQLDPTFDVLLALADGLGVKPGLLVGDAEALEAHADVDDSECGEYRRNPSMGEAEECGARAD